jgi:fucose permease
MGSVLAMESFKNDFGLPHGSDGFSNEKNASVSSNVVSLLTAGSFFGAIAAAFINEKWGRLYTLMGFCGIFNVGAALQTAAHHDIALIYAGRVIAGVGIGGCSAVMSVFVSEAAPPKIRGRIAGLFQEMLVIGSTFAYWLGEFMPCSVQLLCRVSDNMILSRLRMCKAHPFKHQAMESPGVDPAGSRRHHVLRLVLPEGKSQMALQARSPRQSRSLTGPHPMQDGGRSPDHHRDG